MTQTVASAPKPLWPSLRPYLRAIVPLTILVVAAMVLHPKLSLLAPQPVAVKVHLAFAISALFLGGVMMASRKGARFHRTAGWIWVTMMMTVAISSLFVTGLNGAHWSWIHALSLFTIVSLPAGVWAARTHQVKPHRRTMMGVFYGGLIIAGLFTFIPGRVMYQIFFGG